MRPVSVGIVSLGDMGSSIARLLKAHGYRVFTVSEGRSEATLARIRAASVESLPLDQDLVVEADYILSIVPPRDALATAQRIAKACSSATTATRRNQIEDADGCAPRSQLVYIDLNATPARVSQETEALFSHQSPDTDSSENSNSSLCHFLDGGIIGGPASQERPSLPHPNSGGGGTGEWKRPSLVVSGPAERLPPSFPALAKTLNLKVVSPAIGAAATLKLTFAALTKGLTALSLLSFSTAQREQLLPELLEHLERYSPHTAALATMGVTGMAPKAYRWVEEMRGIGEALDSEGKWNGVGGSVYDSFAEVYRIIAEETILGEEAVGKRKRGTTVSDVAEIVAESRGRGVDVTFS